MNAEERRKEIEERKEAPGDSVRLWCKDERRLFCIYRVPVDALLLNPDNRRFVAERRLMEQRLGHSLDPENSADDELSVISILLDSSLDVDGTRVTGQPSKDYESLKTDWQRRGQQTPFWIRPDGIVRNGNRRLAMLKRLRGEGGLAGTEWVEAIILDTPEINEHDLMEMEQREQLTEDFKVRYTDINLLLALREAAVDRSIDWADPESIQRIAADIQQVAGGEQAYAVIQLQAIRYMDAYLDDADAPGDYHKLLRQVERFRDVGKNMARIDSEYPDDAPGMLRLCFAAIRAGNPHDDIRAIWRMFLLDRPRYNNLLKGVEEDETEWEEGEESDLPDPDLTTGADEEDEYDDESEDTGPTVTNYPEAVVKTRIKNAIDGYAAANLDVFSTLEQVVSRLDALDRDPETVALALKDEKKGPEARERIERVIAWASNASEYFGGDD